MREWWALANELCEMLGMSQVSNQLLVSEGHSSVEVRSDMLRTQRLIKIYHVQFCIRPRRRNSNMKDSVDLTMEKKTTRSRGQCGVQLSLCGNFAIKVPYQALMAVSGRRRFPESMKVVPPPDPSAGKAQTKSTAITTAYYTGTG
jgi:hypothetical protein